MLERIAQVESAIVQSWCAETSSHPDIWSDQTRRTRAIGQAAASALVLRDQLGGQLIHCTRVVGTREVPHFYNRLPDEPSTVFDITESYRTTCNELLVNMRRAEPEQLLAADATLLGRYELLAQLTAEQLTQTSPPFSAA